MLVEKEDWQLRAACGRQPKVAFFEDALIEGNRIRAKAPRHDVVRNEFCAACPVRRDCLALAMDAEQGVGENHRFGIFGGLTPQQRLSLQKRGGYRCPQCGAAFDPFGYLEGHLECDCGYECDPLPLPDEGDDWHNRHTALAAKVVAWLIENVEVHHNAPSPSRLAQILGTRKADVVRVYEALTVDNTLVKVERTYVRMATSAAMRQWRPPHLAA